MEKDSFEARRQNFAEKFERCQPALSAVGDETRQLIIRTLIENCGIGGIRVGEIQKSTNISRTAVSHHLKILKEAGIITVRQSGTKNFYYLDPESSSMRRIAEFWNETVEMMGLCHHVREEKKE